jgi:gp32-like DNA binding protein
MDFSKLKSMSGKKSLETLTNEVAKFASSSQSKDDRFWYPQVDKAGNGYAVIRFLPPPPDEDVPFVRIFEHGFKGPGGAWYIENSLTTIGQNDPVSEYNSKLWNTGLDSNKEIVRKQKRKLVFISNVLVAEDQLQPEAVGHTFLFKYGKKIFDKLNEAMNPQFKDEEAINPFDFWTGANFKIKIRNVENYRNYDKSEFAKPGGPLSDDDAVLEAIWKSEHSLQQFLAPSQFKPYAELKAKLYQVLGLQVEAGPTVPAPEPMAIDLSKFRGVSAPVLPTAEADTPPFDVGEPSLGQEPVEEDEGLSFFKKLAE